MYDVHQCLIRTFRGKPRRKDTLVVAAVHRPQPQDATAQLWLERVISGSHVEEPGWTSTVSRKLTGMQHCRRRGLLGVGVVGMEGLEESRALSVETPEPQVTQLSTKVFSEDEPGVNDLTLFAVTQSSPSLGSSDRVFNRAENLGQGSHAGVV
jgi:hypothetical protein